MPTDLNTCMFYFISSLCAPCARASHPVRRQPASATAAAAWRRACVTALDDARGTRPNERGVGVCYATLAAQRMYVQPSHWSTCHLSRTCMRHVLTRGLMRPSSALTPGSWEASMFVPTLHGIGRLPEHKHDRGVSPVDMLAPGRTASHGKGGTTCARSPAM